MLLGTKYRLKAPARNVTKYKESQAKLFFSIAHYTSSIDEFTKARVQPQDFFFKSETQNSVTLIQW